MNDVVETFFILQIQILQRSFWRYYKWSWCATPETCLDWSWKGTCRNSNASN